MFCLTLRFFASDTVVRGVSCSKNGGDGSVDGDAEEEEEDDDVEEVDDSDVEDDSNPLSLGVSDELEELLEDSDEDVIEDDIDVDEEDDLLGGAFFVDFGVVLAYVSEIRTNFGVT